MAGSVAAVCLGALLAVWAYTSTSTAHEVALALAPVFPAEAEALADAADGFDAVRYGGRPASESRARAVVELDDRLQRTSPVVAVRPRGPTFPVPR